MNARRERAEQRGRRAETLAAWYLRLKGWRIVAQRCRVPGGEVDLVAKRGRTVAFVEVKWRDRPGDLDTAIDEYRLRRVVVAAERLAPRYARNGEDVRIDVMLLAPWRWPSHLANVWISRL
ncbi:MAG: YraN family protein [Sphingopyxis sp.]|jgi:putative endonuclease|nr:YraN family protein [Sphingopyxis sp.]